MYVLINRNLWDWGFNLGDSERGGFILFQQQKMGFIYDRHMVYEASAEPLQTTGSLGIVPFGLLGRTWDEFTGKKMEWVY